MTDIASQPAVHLWLVLFKAYRAMRAHAETHVRSLGLGFSDFAVLEALLHKGPLPVNAIGEIVHLTSGSISTAVDRLESKDLVARCKHDTDGRTRLVHLTPEGRRLIDEAFAAHAAAMERAAGGLSAGEREEAAALLKKLGLHAEALLHR
jgi:MarR family transcriptional regulator, 2-MHQ and catechol-resistance regulon repressor